jgi:hypothetical protein
MVVRAVRSPRFTLAEFVAFYFSCSGCWYFLDEFNQSRVFVGRKPVRGVPVTNVDPDIEIPWDVPSKSLIQVP